MGGCGLMPLSEMVDVSSFLVNTDGKCWLSMLALVRLSDLSGTPLIWTACYLYISDTKERNISCEHMITILITTIV